MEFFFFHGPKPLLKNYLYVSFAHYPFALFPCYLGTPLPIAFAILANR